MNLLWRLRTRLFGYGPAFQGFNFGDGYNVLCFATNWRGCVLASRHPRWSITWLWSVSLILGGSWRPCWFMWRDPGGDRAGRITSMEFGALWVRIHYSRQAASPYGPGNPHFNLAAWRAYVDRLARARADAAVKNAWQAAYDEEVLRMNTPERQA